MVDAAATDDRVDNKPLVPEAVRLLRKERDAPRPLADRLVLVGLACGELEG